MSLLKWKELGKRFETVLVSPCYIVLTLLTRYSSLLFVDKYILLVSSFLAKYSIRKPLETLDEICLI